MKFKLSSLILFLLLALTIFTVYLAVSEFSGSAVCLTGSSVDASNCLSVQNSEYGSLLGFKVSYLGATGVFLLLVLYFFKLMGKRYWENFYEIYLLGTIIGSVGAVYFLSIQFFVLNTICSSCIFVDGAILFISALSWYEKWKMKQAPLV